MPKLNADSQFAVTRASLACVLRAWGIGVFAYEEAVLGIENRTVFVSTQERECVLRVYRQSRKDDGAILEELSFMRALAQSDSRVPDIVRSSCGELLARVEADGSEWRAVLMGRRPGRHPEAYSLEVCAQMGRALAEVHRLSLAYRCPRQDACPVWSVEERWKDVDAATRRRRDVRTFIERVRAHPFPDAGLPTAHLHGDFLRTNILRSEGVISGILDFDDMEYGPLLMDVAVPVWHMLVETGGEPAAAFVRAYHRIRPLERKELRALPAMVRFVNGTRGIDHGLLHDFGEEWERILGLEEALKGDERAFVFGGADPRHAD